MLARMRFLLLIVLHGNLALAQVGTAASPSVQLGAGSSTGIFSSSPGVFNISTGGGERLRIDSNGNVAIGATSAAAGLDVSTTGTLASAILVPRDTTGNRPSSPVNGMIRYALENVLDVPRSVLSGAGVK